jgi:hypothetical protein
MSNSECVGGGGPYDLHSACHCHPTTRDSVVTEQPTDDEEDLEDASMDCDGRSLGLGGPIQSHGMCVPPIGFAVADELTLNPFDRYGQPNQIFVL